MTPLGVELVALQILLMVLALLSPLIAEGFADPFGVDALIWGDWAQRELERTLQERHPTQEQRARLVAGTLHCETLASAGLEFEERAQMADRMAEGTVALPPEASRGLYGGLVLLDNLASATAIVARRERRYGFDPATGLYPNEEPWRPGPAPTDPSDVAPLDWALREHAAEWKRRRMADVPQADPDIEDLSEDEDVSSFSGPASSEDEEAHRRGLMVAQVPRINASDIERSRVIYRLYHAIEIAARHTGVLPRNRLRMTEMG